MAAVFRLRPPAPSEAAELVASLASQTPTYAEVGATAGALPVGYHHLDRSLTVGHGTEAFAAAVEGLRRWQAHRGAGLTVHPGVPPLEPGTDVLSVARAGPLIALAGCRIVYVVDEPTRFGFAYGTLPLHPEVGEEAFLLERSASGQVTFRVRAFSRPGHLLTRLGGPVATLVQRQTAGRYLRGLRDHVRRNGGGARRTL